MVYSIAKISVRKYSHVSLSGSDVQRVAPEKKRLLLVTPRSLC